jgi:ATP-dependent Clp protease ATP-binding subunit ClpA
LRLDPAGRTVHGVFERFTEDSRQVVIQAQAEARALGHFWIGTEHLLLALLGDHGAGAAEVLESFGLDLDRAREDVARIVGVREEPVTGQIPFTPRAKKTLELALREALGLRHSDIRPEHILLGLVHEDEGVGARILLEYDVDPAVVRDRLLLRLPSGALLRHEVVRGRFAVPSASRWEYRVERDLEAERLNELGAEGWELVAAVPEGDDIRLFLKRPAPPAAAEEKPAA